MNLIELIQANPKSGAVIAIINLLLAESISEVQIPTIFMQCFQLMAWAITISVGLITLIGIYKNRKK